MCKLFFPTRHFEKVKNKLSAYNYCLLWIYFFQLNFQLIESILLHIHNLDQDGAILVFLPGWNLIFALMKYLNQHRIFGDKTKFLILPLHSQIPREDQKKVFITPPPEITKVRVFLLRNKRYLFIFLELFALGQYYLWQSLSDTKFKKSKNSIISYRNWNYTQHTIRIPKITNRMLIILKFIPFLFIK